MTMNSSKVSVAKNPVVEWFANVAPADRASVLGDFLRGKSQLQLPADFYRPAAFVVACLNRDHFEVAQGIGDTALTFVKGWKHTEDVTEIDRLEGVFLTQVLFLIEALPLSDPQEAAASLNQLRQVACLHGWPSREEDCHRSVLLALASQLAKCSPDPQRWAKRLESDMKNPTYAVASLSCLIEESVSVALARMPLVLDLLIRHKIPSSDLLRKLARCLAKNRDWGPDLTESIENLSEWHRHLLAKTLRKLRLDECAAKMVSSPYQRPRFLKGQQRTFVARAEEVKRRWYVVNVEGQVVGRIATVIASILRGKHRPDFSPHIDMGDYVVVTNAARLQLTGKKWRTKVYSAYSHFPGGLKLISAQEKKEKDPGFILHMAIKRMIPRTSLGRAQMRKLKIYAGSQHPHQAQQPIPLPLEMMPKLRKSPIPETPGPKPHQMTGAGGGETTGRRQGNHRHRPR